MYESALYPDRPEQSWASSQFITGGARPVRTSSSSSLAFALDESITQTRRSVRQEAQPLPSYGAVPSLSGPESPQSVGSETHCGVTTFCPESSIAAANWLPNGMSFPEATYEGQYAATFGKQASIPFNEYEATLPYHEIADPNNLTIDGGMSGVEYMDTFAPVSPDDYSDYAFDFCVSPIHDEPMVIPSPPTAAQISRSSTLADAMTLPPALRTVQQPLPPLPSVAVSSPVQPAASCEPTLLPSPTTLAPNATPESTPSTPPTPTAQPVIKSEPSGPATLVHPVAPEPRADAPPKKRSYKATGRPRGRPPKNPLTSVPRNQVSLASSADAASADSSAGNDASQTTSEDASFNADDVHPGQSTFMLDTAVPEPPKKKPIMACLFCRERKIGCGPPPPEQEDQTCKQCKRRGLICEWPTECRRGQHKRGPRKKRDADALEQGDDATDGAGSSSTAPLPKSKSKRKAAETKLDPEELERRQVAVDIQAVTERQTALKRQRKLAAAQHKRLVEMRMLAT